MLIVSLLFQLRSSNFSHIIQFGIVMLFNVFRRNRKNGAKLLHTSTRTQNGLLKRRKTTSSTSYHSVVVLFIFEQHVFNSTRRKWIKLCTVRRRHMFIYVQKKRISSTIKISDGWSIWKNAIYSDHCDVCQANKTHIVTLDWCKTSDLRRVSCWALPDYKK